MISAKKMTSQERKEMERAAQKHKSKTKLWVSVNDKGSKTKRGKWAGNATFQWKGEDTKHATEIPLRTGDVLKLKGKDLWVHPKEGEPFQYAGEKDEDEPKPEDQGDDADAEEEAPAPKQKPKKQKPVADEDGEEEDNFDDEEGAGPLTEEEIAADEEAEAIAAEEEKLALRKTALKADKAARAAKRKADAARDALAQKGIGTKLKTQVEDEGVDPVAADLADKVMKLAGKQSLGSFVKSLLFLGLGIKSGGESVKQLGPALRAQLAAKRKELEAKGDDIIDAEFTVIENLKALDSPKLLPSGPLAPADDSDIDSLMELQKKHGIGLADAKLMRERLLKKQKDEKAAAESAAAARAAKPPPLPKKKKPPDDEDLPMAKDEDVVAASLRRVQAALKKMQAFNKRQALPEDAKLVTTTNGKDVYAVDEWFYWVDPKTGEVTQIELQKHSPFLQKFLKKGFFSRLAAAAPSVPSVDEVRSVLSSMKAPKGTGWSGGSRNDKLLREFGEQKNSRGLPMLFAESTLDADRTEDLVMKRLEDAFGPGLFAVEGGDYSVAVQWLSEPEVAEAAGPAATAFLEEVQKGSTLSKIWKRLTDADVKKLKIPANMVGTSFEKTEAPSGAVYLWSGSKLFALLGDEVLFGRFTSKPWPTDVIYDAEWSSSHARNRGERGGLASVRPVLVKNRMKPVLRKKNAEGELYFQET